MILASLDLEFGVDDKAKQHNRKPEILSLGLEVYNTETRQSESIYYVIKNTIYSKIDNWFLNYSHLTTSKLNDGITLTQAVNNLIDILSHYNIDLFMVLGQEDVPILRHNIETKCNDLSLDASCTINMITAEIIDISTVLNMYITTNILKKEYLYQSSLTNMAKNFNLTVDDSKTHNSLYDAYLLNRVFACYLSECPVSPNISDYNQYYNQLTLKIKNDIKMKRKARHHVESNHKHSLKNKRYKSYTNSDSFVDIRSYINSLECSNSRKCKIAYNLILTPNYYKNCVNNKIKKIPGSNSARRRLYNSIRNEIKNSND